MISPTTSNIDVSTGNFSIEMNASMFTMLTKNVYSNVILAPIREWSTNAIDACLEASIDPHFDVQLPTPSDLTFAVRDYGAGLPEDSLIGLFTILGASTKRDSNDFNGQFGIGRMSALAYSSSFTVESFYNSHHYVYLISIRDGIPVYLKLSDSPSSEPTGLRLSLAVQPQDVDAFISEATHLYRFFSTRPTTNIPLNYADPTLSGSDWCIYPDLSGAYFVMANVPYRYKSNIANGLCISIPTGSVSINPGRESLTYDPLTTTFIDQTIDTVKADIQANLVASIQSLPTLIEQLVALSTSRRFSFISLKPADISPTLAIYANDWHELRSPPTFDVCSISTYDSSITNYSPNPERATQSHILIQDVPTGFISASHKALKSVSLSNTLILRPKYNTKTSITVLLADYQAYLQTMGITAIPLFLSSFVTATAKSTSSKLAVTTFQPSTISGGKLSNIDTATDTSTYYYLLEPPSDPAKFNLFHQATGITIIVIPKRAHSLVATLPNFHLADHATLQSVLDSYHFTYIDKPTNSFINSNYYYFSELAIPSRLDIAAHYDTAKALKPTHAESLITSLSTYFSLSTEPLSVPITIADIEQAYPLYRVIINGSYYSDRKQQLSTYIALEDSYHALSSTSRLSSSA